jgi:cullin-4
MPSSAGKSGETIASDHRKSTKRKAEQPDRASGIAEKRFKTSQTPLPYTHPADKTPMSSRLRVIDLTTPSMFQPSTGAKQLVIKNLKKTSKAQVDTYYKRTWDELDRAVTDLFTRNHPTQPLEVLFRGVEATCRHEDADRLYTHLRDRCKGYLEKKLLPKIEKETGTSYTDAVRTVQKYWTLWNEQSVSRTHVNMWLRD